MKLLQLLQKNLTYSIPAFMILGLIYGSIFNTQILKLAILPLTFVMVYPMMVNLNIKKVFSKGDGKLQWVTQLINFIIVPLIGFSLGEMFFSDEPLVALGLLLVALIPTSGMTVSWTGFAKGNMEAAIKMTVIGLVLGSVLIPFYLQGLMGTALELPMFKIFSQILMVIFLPMLAGYITQQLIIKKYGRDKYQKNLKQIFPPISTLGVVGIVFVAMALKAKAILTHPEVLLEYALPLLLLYGLIFFITTIIGKYFFSREDSIALVYGTAMRNLSIALAIAMTVFGNKGSEIALIIAVAYIIQVQAASWYMKYSAVIFGKSVVKVVP